MHKYGASQFSNNLRVISAFFYTSQVSPVAGIGSNVRAVSAAYTTFRFVTAMTAVVTDRTRLAVTRAFAMWATSPVTRVDALMRHSLARDFQYVETARTKAPKRAQTVCLHFYFTFNLSCTLIVKKLTDG